jgi:hypothetical protein
LVLPGNRNSKDDLALCRIALGVTKEVTHTTQTNLARIAPFNYRHRYYGMSPLSWEDEEKRDVPSNTIPGTSTRKRK